MGYCLVRFAALCSLDAKRMRRDWDMDFSYDNTMSKEILKVKYRGLKNSIIEMTYGLIT